MKRKIYKKMIDWKNNSHGKTALLIEGARRVGKSYIVEEFAKNNYKTYLIIDFAFADSKVKNLFNEYLENLDTFFFYLSEFYGVKFYERETLIVFDEVQFCPKARSAIKKLVSDGRYDYIETGSLISIHKNVKDILIPSEEEKLTLYPMDFEEFLWAMGNDTLMDYIKKCFNEQKPLEKLLHRKAMDYYKKYLILGGMPQVIKSYIETKDFSMADKVKRTILNLYREDIRKHAEELNLKVEKIFDTIPSQLSKHEKKFNLSTLDENARFRNYEGAFYWLKDAGIINIAYNTTEPNIGLGQRIDDNSLKCYFFDTGLLIAMIFNEENLAKEEIYKKILFDKLSFNEGIIIENIVAQQLTSSGRKLYFFSKYNYDNSQETMEIDFLISKNMITSKHNIIPIEVKSGNRYTFNSLKKLKNKYGDYIDKPIIIHPKNLQKIDDILYLPLYMTILL